MTEIQQQNTSELELIEVDIQLLCRFCGSFNENDQIISIFDHVGLENELPKRIEEYLPIKIYESDILPTKICIQCTKTIITWHKFILSCDETNKRFQNMIENMSNDVYHDEAENVAETFDETVEYLQDDEAEEITSKSEITGDFNGDNISTEQNFTIEDQHSMVKEEAVETEDEDEKDGVENKKPNRSSNSTWCSKQITETPIKNSFLCDIIDTESNLISTEYLNNLKVIFTPKKGKYECTDCDFKTTKKLDIEKHLVDSHPEYDLSIVKTLRPDIKFDKKFAEDNKVLINGKTFYQCPECKKHLFTMYNFKWHMKIHTNERLFICYLCGKTFRVHQGLSRHIKETHEKSREYPCDICGRKFGNRRNVVEHQRLHSNERIYVCEICQKSFKQKASLFVHKRCHSPTKFKCSECNLGFRSKSQMNVHITIHSGEKNNECDICHRKFRIKHELNKHKLIHSDLKPFSCKDCSGTFRQKRYLIRHLKIYHTEKVLKD